MSAKELTENEILVFLKNIESGEIRLTPNVEAQQVFAGNVEYQASNGWRITIFNDANEWDYIDEIVTNDGRQIEYNQLESMPLVNKYVPSDEISWEGYGIPGYCKFKCKKCGTEFKYKKDNIFQCEKCRLKW